MCLSSPQHPERIEDHRDVDRFLDERPLHRRQIAECGDDHAGNRQSQSDADALACNRDGAMRYSHRRQ